MKAGQTVWAWVRHRLTATPVICALLAIAIHNGFAHADLFTVSPFALVVLVIMAALYVLYFLPPVKLVARTPLAPFISGLLYVCGPYIVGLGLWQTLPSSADYPWLAGFYLLYVGQAILYGIRQSSADAKTAQKNKPVAMLTQHFSKDTACFVSLACVIVGSLLLIWQVRNALWLVAIIGLYLGALAFSVIQLADTPQKEEANAVDVISITATGLLVTILVAYTLVGLQAPTIAVAIVAGMVAAAFLGIFFWFLGNPNASLPGQR